MLALSLFGGKFFFFSSNWLGILGTPYYYRADQTASPSAHAYRAKSRMSSARSLWNVRDAAK